MSPRQTVDRQRIELFLSHLGRRFRSPGRIYLVGGTTLVFEGFRSQTLDIDLTFEVDPQDHGAFIEAVRELKDTLSINVEEVSPGHFIPLPAGYRERCPFIGRYGQLDVFHFDLYSTALSKVERGTEEDFADVIALLEAGRIDMDHLERHFQDIMLRYAIASLKQDPAKFRRKFEALKQMWGSRASAR